MSEQIPSDIDHKVHIGKSLIVLGHLVGRAVRVFGNLEKGEFATQADRYRLNDLVGGQALEGSGITNPPIAENVPQLQTVLPEDNLPFTNYLRF